VPGFLGWGAPLFGTVNYFGGVIDIPKILVDRGYTVIVASVSPISSNWERACELYRQLTFGQYVFITAHVDILGSLLSDSALSIRPQVLLMRSMMWTLTTELTLTQIQLAPQSKPVPRAEGGQSCFQTPQPLTTGGGTRITKFILYATLKAETRYATSSA
jgi:hypothetical protein